MSLPNQEVPFTKEQMKAIVDMILYFNANYFDNWVKTTKKEKKHESLHGGRETPPSGGV